MPWWDGPARVGDGATEKTNAWITVHRPKKGSGTAMVICPGGGYASDSNFAQIGACLYRRDLTEAEFASIVAHYMGAIDDGALLKDAFVREVTALMTAPDFLCVVEQPGKLTDFALAARLSYFLWNSAPDAELLEFARQGKLSDPIVLRAQTERLLNDAKSDRFVEDFLDQWLGLWGIDNTTPDKDLYPEYDDELKISCTLETRATFRHMLDHNLSVRDFVAPNWAMVNARLAKLYGVSDIDGFQIRKVPLPADTPFGGIWTQASTMKVTANGTLTSPVKRGVWASDRLLGITIPPPPNVEPVVPDTRGAKTLRKQRALHSQQGSCKACHARFDPYGFALESFDVMGNFRTNYRVANGETGKAQKTWMDGLPRQLQRRHSQRQTIRKCPGAKATVGQPTGSTRPRRDKPSADIRHRRTGDSDRPADD